jgi:hypothetical protein
MSTLEQDREGPPGPDQDEHPLTGGVDSAPEPTGPPPSGTTPPAPGHHLARVSVPAVPRGWAQPKRRAHRRQRHGSTWMAVAVLAAIATVSMAVAVWGLVTDGPAVQSERPAPAPANVPRLERALGRPAEPSRTAITTGSLRVALFDIPALGIHETLAEGDDPGTGPVLWPGTPWPGGPGRAVVALWADLSTLRPGHEVLVGAAGGYAVWRVATVRQVPADAWDRVTGTTSLVPELALVEAAAFEGRTTRTLVVAWPVP